ncbi:hypothetical protein [Kribbella monticola]|uniref:hypothetical protein n=1 Tax=Kribbella monticola TaxID=2185285 RepID=UPI000DD34877|nr:hypothetical protein [Kribbella monticola]
MLTKLRAVADQALARIVPQAEASACPVTYYDYKCLDHVKFRRTCYRNVECATISCGAWQHIGSC